MGLKLPLRLIRDYNALRNFWVRFYLGCKVIGDMSKECLDKIFDKENENMLTHIKMKHINS